MANLKSLRAVETTTPHITKFWNGKSNYLVSFRLELAPRCGGRAINSFGNHRRGRKVFKHNFSSCEFSIFLWSSRCCSSLFASRFRSIWHLHAADSADEASFLFGSDVRHCVRLFFSLVFAKSWKNGQPLEREQWQTNLVKFSNWNWK